MADAHDRPVLSILMPVYNEEDTLRRCVETVLSAPLPEEMGRELVLVDDCSTDSTPAILRELAEEYPESVRVFRQPRNLGKGAAVRRSITEMKGQYAIIQDADLEYDPKDYVSLLEPVLAGKADVVYGSRFAPRRMRQVLGYHHKLGNLFLTHLSNAFTGLSLTDMETCYKLFRADILKTLPLRSNRFGIEPEITAKIAKRGCVVYEVPIDYHGRTYAEGKKIGWKDGVSAICTILKYRLLDDCYDERLGAAHLSDPSRSRRASRWAVRLLAPLIGKRVLELGSGIGNVSRYLPLREKLVLSDPSENCRALLQNCFRDEPRAEVREINLETGEGLQAGEFDTVIWLSGLESVEDDCAALRAIGESLAPGGKLLLAVPQHQRLFGSRDLALGYLRRYGRFELAGKFRQAGLHLKDSMTLNSAAVLPWWLGNEAGMGRFSRITLKLLEMSIPLAKLAEKLLPLSGITLLCVAEKGE